MKFIDWLWIIAIMAGAIGYMQYQNDKALEMAFINGLQYTAAIAAVE